MTPLLNATGRATDPGRRSAQPLDIAAVGVPDGAITGITFRERLPGLNNDPAVWQALASDPRYVVLDGFFGSTGGPAGDYYDPGDTLALTDPRTGRSEQKVIAGVLSNGMVFYPGTGASSTTYPVVLSEQATRELFGAQAQNASALVSTSPGTSPDTLATRLQGEQLSSSPVATPIESDIRQQFDSSTAFFRLMQGFLALGLGVLTTWLMDRNSAAFEGLGGGFPVEWAGICGLAAAAFAASLLATIGPARRAAVIRPALAVRVTE
ncbi:hypothetical protein [Streptomyces sp. NPDC051921]|uniref:hypothetical protein n=1 Tax=Streptomyces sp. NPDC051921 TaxID=3155806 RepID=UPI003413B25B